ncbi:MAG: chalcone isomerase family protein [Burkholderiaceae bacterium]
MRVTHIIAAFAISLASTFAYADTAWVADALPGAQKAGHARLTYLGFKVYDADLWVDADFTPASFSNEPMLLNLTYLRRLKGADIAKRSKDEMAKLGRGTPEQRAQWYEEMKKVFPDVKAGDALGGLHQPGKGVKFFRNGKVLAEVDDPQFAEAFFAIWLDTKTSIPDFRKKLLGSKKGSGE